jgi:adenylosuccinate synthase
MPVMAVVGAQWGDEGKGRVIDYVAAKADWVIRCQGGDNAGHTVVNEFGTFRLHLVPSGIFHPRVRCVIGAGTVVNPLTLVQEMDTLASVGVDLERLWLDQRAHLVLPYHRLLDGLEEGARGDAALGTTKRGIGPAYADKATRIGLRVGDLCDLTRFRARLIATLPARNRRLADFGEKPLDEEELMSSAEGWAERLRPHIKDSLPFIRQAVASGQQIVLEGQLGALRDLDWGTYPFVTSSNPTAAGQLQGAGIPPRALTEVLAIVKAYTTAVGAGPLPTELKDETGERLRKLGDEYGATTGRPRRCGWFDAVAVRHAAWLSGFTALAVTKLDVLDGLPEVKLCTAYRLGGYTTTDLPDTADMERAVPVYETLAGWQRSTSTARTWNDLPVEARAYLRRIESLVGAPLRYISVGPEREQMIVV